MHIWLVIACVVAILAVGIALVFYKPMGVLLCVSGLCGLGLIFVSLDKSTYPSSASRITVVGRAVDWSAHITRMSYWTFVVMPTSSERILLRTGIDLPMKGNSIALADGDLVRVTYLDESVFGREPRAIKIDVVNGNFAGWSGSSDANWFGWWIGVPIGAVIAASAFGAAQKWKRNQSQDDESGD
jgi:hypothetical protein